MSAPERVVVVLGGAGTVGSGIVKSLLEKGKDRFVETLESPEPLASDERERVLEDWLWLLAYGHMPRGALLCSALGLSPKGFQVAVISRDGSRLEKLRHFLPASLQNRLRTLVGDVGSEAGAEAAREAVLETVGKVTDVVSCLGFSWWQEGPPHTQSLEELQRVLDTLLLSTFTSWKAFFPLVRDNPSGSYTLITGGAGERLLLPGTGFLTLGAAGALAFCRVLREEYPEIPCKLNEVKINMGVTTLERLGPGYVDHLEVGEAVASLVEKRRVSHAVLTAGSPADLKTLTREGKL